MAYDIGPRITLKGEAEFKNALNSVNSELKEYGSELKKVRSEQDGQKKSAESLRKENEVLQKQYDAQQKKLSLYREELEKLTKRQEEQKKALEQATKEFGENSKEAQAAQRAYQATEADISKLNVAINETEAYANNAKNAIKTNSEEIDKLGNKALQASEKLAKVGEGLKKAGDSTMKAGKTMSATVTAPLVGAGVAAVKMATDFEDSLAKVSTIADTTAVPMDQLESQIKALSDQTGISSSEIAENVYNAISAGQKTGDAVNFVSNSTKLAKAGFADAGQSLDLLTTIMNAYGLEAGEVTKVSDMLVQTQNLGKTTVGELSSAMGKVIPTANATNTSLDQLCAGYAIMTANGLTSAESTTYMNSMLNELSKTGSTTDEVLRNKTGKSFSELMASGSSLGDVLSIVNEGAKEQNLTLSDMFSSAEAGRAGLILLGDSTKEFNGTLKEMQDSAGATGEAFDKVMGTRSQEAAKVMNQVRNVAIDLGKTLLESLAPVIGQISKAVSEFCTWFSSLDTNTKNLILTIGGLVAAIGPVLMIAGSLMGAVGNIMTTGPKLVKGVQNIWNMTKTLGNGLKTLWGILSANPIVLVVAAIAALVAGFIWAYNNVEWFRDGVNACLRAIGKFFDDVFGAIGKWLSEDLPNFLNNFGENWNNFWTGVGDFLKETWEKIWNTITGIMQAIIDFVTDNWQGLLLLIVNPFAGAFKLLYDNCDEFRAFVDEWVGKIWTAITSTFGDMWDKAKNWGKDLVDGFVSGIKSMWSSLTGTVKDVAKTVADFLHFSVPEKGPLADFDESGGDMIDLIIEGVRGKRDKLRKTIEDVAGIMNVQPTYAVNGGGTIVVENTLNLDGRVIHRSENRLALNDAKAARIAKGG